MKLYRIDFYDEDNKRIAQYYGFPKRIFELIYAHHVNDSQLAWMIFPLSKTFKNFYKCLTKDVEIY